MKSEELTPVRKWEHFGCICERHGPFAQGINRREQIDEEDDQPKMCPAFQGNPEATAGGKKGPEQVRERRQQKRPATKGVDVEHSNPCKQKGDKTKSTRSCQGDIDRRSRLHEDRTTVERDNVDPANLLRELGGINKSAEVRIGAGFLPKKKGAADSPSQRRHPL